MNKSNSSHVSEDGIENDELGFVPNIVAQSETKFFRVTNKVKDKSSHWFWFWRSENHQDALCIKCKTTCKGDTSLINAKRVKSVVTTIESIISKIDATEKVFPNTSSKVPNFKGQVRSLADKVQSELDHLHASTRKGFKSDFDKQITSLDKRVELIQSQINSKDTKDLDELKEKVENLSTLVHTEENEKVEREIQILRVSRITHLRKNSVKIFCTERIFGIGILN